MKRYFSDKFKAVALVCCFLLIAAPVLAGVEITVAPSAGFSGVTSVGVLTGTGMTSSGSPVTGAGNITLGLTSNLQSWNILAIPFVNGILPIGAGGTGANTVAGVLTALGITNPVLFEGTINAVGSPNFPAANAGDTWVISTAGNIGGVGGPAVSAGDGVICTTSNGGGTNATVDADFTLVQNTTGVVTNPSAANNNHFPWYIGTSGVVLGDSGYGINNFVLPGQPIVSSDAGGQGSWFGYTSSAAEANPKINIGGTVTTTTPALMTSSVGQSGTFFDAWIHRHSTSQETRLVGSLTNSSSSSHAAVVTGQAIFDVIAAAMGDTSGNYIPIGMLRFGVDSTGTVNASSMPGNVSLCTTVNGAVPNFNLTTIANMNCMTLNSAGLLSIPGGIIDVSGSTLNSPNLPGTANIGNANIGGNMTVTGNANVGKINANGGALNSITCTNCSFAGLTLTNTEAYLGAAQNLTTNAVNLMFNTVNWDTANGMNLTSGGFTVPALPANSFCSIDLQAFYDGACNIPTFLLKQNGNSVTEWATPFNLSSGGSLPAFHKTVKVSSGDILYITGRVGAGTGLLDGSGGGGIYTFVDIRCGSQ